MTKSCASSSSSVESHQTHDELKKSNSDEAKSGVFYSRYVPVVAVLLLMCLGLISCLHRSTEKQLRVVPFLDGNEKSRQLVSVALADVGFSCNSGETLIDSKCYLACNDGYSPDSTGKICVKNCASGETSTATMCTIPQLDAEQFDCGFGCAGTFVSCSSANGRSYYCVDDGYRFPVYRCHCRTSAITYARATTTRTWKCPAGSYTSLGSCVACSAGSYQSTEGQSSCVACSAGTYTSSAGAKTSSTCPDGSYTPSRLDMEFSFDSGTVTEASLANGGATVTTAATLYNSPTISSVAADVKVGTGSIQLSASGSQYVAIPSFTSGSTGLSFACWFKSVSNGVWARILDFGNGQATDNIIMAINGNGLALSLYSGSVTASQPLNVIPSINDGVWRHVVWTLDPSGVWTVYLNGAVTWQVTGYAYPAAITRTSNFLGKSNWQNDPYFSGGIDEFRMYSRVLTASDAQLVYSGDASFSTAYGAAACIVSTPSPTTNPSFAPSAEPSLSPTSVPSTTAPTTKPTYTRTNTPSQPTLAPSVVPSTIPSLCPTSAPSKVPTTNAPTQPTIATTLLPSTKPSSSIPSSEPSATPTSAPAQPTTSSSWAPTVKSSSSPTFVQSKVPSTTMQTNTPSQPTVAPTALPTAKPSSSPTTILSTTPTTMPTNTPAQPTVAPTSLAPTKKPSSSPTTVLSTTPTNMPTNAPVQPTVAPTASPTAKPSSSPTTVLSTTPTTMPTNTPAQPTVAPTSLAPTKKPSSSPTTVLSNTPTTMPTNAPTVAPTSLVPTAKPSSSPTTVLSTTPTTMPTNDPALPTVAPTSLAPTKKPSSSPTTVLSTTPTTMPTNAPALPTVAPTSSPTKKPSLTPTSSPTGAPSVKPTTKP